MNQKNKQCKNGFWSDNKNSSIVLQEMKTIKSKKLRFENIANEAKNLLELNDLLLIEEEVELAKELIRNTEILMQNLEKLEIETLLSREI